MKSKIYAIVSAIILIISIIGSTLAFVYYRSSVTSVSLTVEPSLDPYINYSSGTPILGSAGQVLNSSSTYEGGLSTEIEFWKTTNARNMDIYGHIFLDITSGSDELLNMESLKWAVTSNGVLISEGNFVGYSEGSSVPILVNQKLLSSYTTFKIYVWIDENSITGATGEGEVFSVTARCEASSGEYEYIDADSVPITGEFDYTGDIQTVNLSKGTYLLEVWGAQGGYALDETYRGGYGGYSSGYITLDTTTTLYVAVGGQGGNGTLMVSTLNAGGYNGGGNTYGATNKYTGSGGGATHIALSDGVLSSLSDNINNILIVAAGGGGSSYYQETSWNLGGNGGGYIGNNGTQSSTTSAYGEGGSQTSGGSGYISGSFGQGANGTTESIGGGGGFYGGGAGRYNSSGGGGSGYIGNTLLTDKVMYCYNCTESTEESTKTISTENVSDEAITGYAKKGNGYVRILGKSAETVTILSREVITYGTDYDFKGMVSNELPDGYTVIYSTYDNANVLNTGEYQIKYIVMDSNGNKYTYYQKIEIV